MNHAHCFLYAYEPMKHTDIMFFILCILGMGFSGGSDGKESTCNVEDLDSIPGLGRFPGEGHGNPLQYSSLENPLGQRSLAGSMESQRVRLSD